MASFIGSIFATTHRGGRNNFVTHVSNVLELLAVHYVPATLHLDNRFVRMDIVMVVLEVKRKCSLSTELDGYLAERPMTGLGVRGFLLA